MDLHLFFLLAGRHSDIGWRLSPRLHLEWDNGNPVATVGERFSIEILAALHEPRIA